MKRILIIGSPGSGKSTFARKLSNILNIECIHLDKLFWQSGWVETPKEIFDSLLIENLNKDEWIIDGNYGRTLDLRLSFADTVIFFDYPRYLCIYRIFKRIVKNYGQTRFDMGDNCPERFDMEFFKFVWNFKKYQRPKIYKKLDSFKNIDIYIIKNKRQFKRFYQNL